MSSTPDVAFMRLALAQAREGVGRGQQPFGACLVQDGTVVACLYNATVERRDITAHPEIEAVRAGCRSLQRLDLSGCTLYATCEPCPMCFTAAHLAQVSTVIYGVSLEDVRQYGFGRFPITNQTLKALGNSPIEVIGGFLHDEGVELLRYWAARQTVRA